jgi:dTDP-4-amino-4,6-dideoxygalactose transaminase
MTSRGDTLPALLGGKPVFPQGPPPWPIPDEDVLHALQAAYADGSWGKYQGEYVERLVRRLCTDHGVEFALPCGSGTYAVELALRALKVGPGDEVLLSAYDFEGNFLSVHALGATPVLLDVSADNWNLNPEQIARAVSPASKALIVSHLHGGLVPMCEVMEIAAAHSLRVVEDAAQAPCADVQGRPAGTWGDVGVLSFGGSKLLSAGRGGALLTRDAGIHQRARLASFRGNQVCPLSELQAAVLLPQLEKLPERNRRRAENVRALSEHLRDVPGVRPFVNRAAGTPGYYKFGLRYDAAAFGLPRSGLVAALRAEGVALDEGFRASHVGRSSSRLRRSGELAEATRAHAGALVLHHPVLLSAQAEITAVAQTFRKMHAFREDFGPGLGP